MQFDEINALKERRICLQCVREAHLSAKIEKAQEIGTCDYCGAEDVPTMSIEELASEVSSAFERHFQRTATDPDGLEYWMIQEGLLDWDRHGDPVALVISEAAQIHDEAAEHVRCVLEYEDRDMERDQMGEEGPFDEEAHYQEAEINDAEFQAEWQYFEQSLKSESRFFNKSAAAVLGMIFEDLAGAKTRTGQPVIRTCGPGTDLKAVYRARVFQSDDKLEQAIKYPDQEVGAPPTWASAAGRMNARGISVFYGATAEAIALAEVRPPVGSRVAIGRFEIIRPIRLLDVAVLESLMVEGSIFDAGYARQLERARFLSGLSARITMPVMPDDEAVHHVVTQAMADYLVGRADLELDGILYLSVQADAAGHNVVLFHRSAKCEAIDLPHDTKLKAGLDRHTDEGAEPDYWVWEEVPVPEASKSKEADGSPAFAAFLSPRDVIGADNRSATLRIDVKSLKVHHVRAVSFKSDVHAVKRDRTEQKQTDDF